MLAEVIRIPKHGIANIYINILELLLQLLLIIIIGQYLEKKIGTLSAIHIIKAGIASKISSFKSMHNIMLSYHELITVLERLIIIIC